MEGNLIIVNGIKNLEIFYREFRQAFEKLLRQGCPFLGKKLSLRNNIQSQIQSHSFNILCSSCIDLAILAYCH